jgi:hypothetical protein
VSPPWFDALAWLLACIALVHAIALLSRGIGAPLIDQHGFRQTQTAVTVRELMRGGPFWEYLTPVVGSPWSIPFEVPIYQAIVALVAGFGLPIETAGRIVSFGFFLTAAWPLRMLWRDLALPSPGLPIAFALLAASPQYSFWSRTVMIESCAWFFALLWLALFNRFLIFRRLPHAVSALIAGVLGILTKSTTLPAFALAGALLLLPVGWRFLRDGCPRGDRSAALLALIVLLLPFAVGVAWVGYSDVVKARNPIGALLTSGSLSFWTFGSWTQRAELVDPGVGGVVMLDMLGWGSLLTPPLLFAACWRRQGWETMVILGCLAGFLAPFLIFTNLFCIHNYYRYANDGFFLVAVAVAAAVLARVPRGAFAVACGLVLVLGAQYTRFQHTQARWMKADPNSHPIYQIALAARSMTPEDGGLIILGDDWDSTIPYYADRRALAMPEWVSDRVAISIFTDPGAHLAGRRFAGVVSCDFGNAPPNAERVMAEQAFLAGRTMLAQHGACTLFSAER